MSESDRARSLGDLLVRLWRWLSNGACSALALAQLAQGIARSGKAWHDQPSRGPPVEGFIASSRIHCPGCVESLEPGAALMGMHGRLALPALQYRSPQAHTILFDMH